MRLRWLTSALLELDGVYEYIAAENSKAAREVFRRIQAAAKQLSQFPNVGRVGRMEGARELVVSGLPYFIVYRVTTEVEIIRVMHMARQWPPGMQ